MVRGVLTPARMSARPKGIPKSKKETRTWKPIKAIHTQTTSVRVYEDERASGQCTRMDPGREASQNSVEAGEMGGSAEEWDARKDGAQNLFCITKRGSQPPYTWYPFAQPEDNKGKGKQQRTSAQRGDNKGEGQQSKTHNPLLGRAARIAVKDLFISYMYWVPFPHEAQQLLDAYYRVNGHSLACPWCEQSLQYGELKDYGTRCSCCIKSLNKTDYVWWCNCSSICAKCGMVGAIRALDRPSEYKMPCSALLQMSM